MSAAIWAKLATEIAKVVGNYQNGKDRSRLMYRIEAAMSYVHVNDKSGEYFDISDEKQKKLLGHFAKRIFDAS